MSDPIVWANGPGGGTAKSATNLNRITAQVKQYIDAHIHNNHIPVFNVKAYGAVGNGITDDTTAITNAINAAHTATYLGSDAVWGGIVHVPLGKYKISSTIYVWQGVTLRGRTGFGSQLIAASGFAGPVVRLGTFFSRLEDINVNCNNVAASTGILINEAQESSGMFRSSVTGWTLTGIDVKQDGGSIDPQHFAIDEIELYPSVSAPVGAVGLRVVGVARAGSMRRITVNAADRTDAAAGVVPVGSVGILLESTPNAGLFESHVENFETGVSLVGARGTFITGLGCNNYTKDAVLIGSTSSKTTCISIVNEAPNLPAGGVAVRDNSPGGSVTSNISAFYSN